MSYRKGFYIFCCNPISSSLVLDSLRGIKKFKKKIVQIKIPIYIFLDRSIKILTRKKSSKDTEGKYFMVTRKMRETTNLRFH